MNATLDTNVCTLSVPHNELFSKNDDYARIFGLLTLKQNMSTPGILKIAVLDAPLSTSPKQVIFTAHLENGSWPGVSVVVQGIDV